MEQQNRIARSIAFAFILSILSVGTNAKAAESKIQLNWQLAPTDKAGSQKTGAACFPSGMLLWRDLAKPDPQLLSSRLQALLEPNEAREASVSGDVTSLKATVCSPWLGMGAQPKSEIKLSIRWTLFSEDVQPTTYTAESRAERKKFDLRTDADLLLEAIEASLRKAVSAKR